TCVGRAPTDSADISRQRSISASALFTRQFPRRPPFGVSDRRRFGGYCLPLRRMRPKRVARGPLPAGNNVTDVRQVLVIRATSKTSWYFVLEGVHEHLVRFLLT